MPLIDLDHYFRSLRESPQQCAAVVQSLMREVDDIRARMDQDGWQRWIATARNHRLREVLSKDPYTARAQAKPRGYAGDAIMLDYVYGHPDVQSSLDETDALGRGVCSYTAGLSPPARAVRWRYRWAATQIENLSAEVAKPEVFALACGHLREAEILHPAAYAAIGTWVAADQDNESLALLRHRYQDDILRPRNISVRDILRGGSTTNGSFHLVYALGLYDYVNSRLGVRLTEALWNMVSPGGRLFLTNFGCDSRGAGYMEAFMDWWLIYRTREEVLELARAVPVDEIATINAFTDPFGAIHYLQLTKKGHVT